MDAGLSLLQAGVGEWRSQADVFNELFLVFLGLGTLVGVVVVAYTLYNAYIYRETGQEDDDEDRPTLGELPTGDKGGKGKKLFLSFAISAIIVISLVVYSYMLLLYVEEGPNADPEAELEVDVEGYQFGWDFEYENGITTTNEMVIPADRVVYIDVTARNVWHTFGVSELRVKSDAIPGQTSTTWFSVDEPTDPDDPYVAECFELCGTGHSDMMADIYVLPPDEFDEWYEENAPDDDEESVQVSISDNVDQYNWDTTQASVDSEAPTEESIDSSEASIDPDASIGSIGTVGNVLTPLATTTSTGVLHG